MTKIRWYRAEAPWRINQGAFFVPKGEKHDKRTNPKIQPDRG